MVQFDQPSGATSPFLSLEQLDAYYRGVPPLSYLHPDLQHQVNSALRSLVINWPRKVVDSVEERLDVEGFRLGGEDVASENLWRIWQANDLDEWSQIAHVEALTLGRTYVMVWPNPQDPSTPRITIESAQQLTVTYDPGTRLIVRAEKKWQDQGRRFVTRYDRRWITRASSEGTDQFRVYDQADNPFGLVPVVAFVNRPGLLRPEGESEMVDVIPISDAINKLATDMMVSAEFHAMPRRWVTGVDIGSGDTEAERHAEKIRQRWEEARASKVWVTDSASATFGQFPEASLSNFVAAMDSLTSRAAAISGLPAHLFGQAGENPASADALRASESALIKKVQRKQRVFGGSWERVMRMALLMAEGSVTTEAKSLETIWRDAETPTIAQVSDAMVKLVGANIVDARYAQERIGCTPVQMAQLAERADAAALGPLASQLAEADRLQKEQGLSQPAAFAAVGLLQSAALQRKP